MTSDRSEDRRVQIQAMLKAEPCDSYLRVCRESWPDDPQSWCAGCLCYAADVELDRLSRERDELKQELETERLSNDVYHQRAVAAESQLSALSTERDALRANLEAEKHRSDLFERECAALSRVQEGLRALVARWRSRSEVLSGQRRGKAAMMRDCASELDAALSPTPASQSEQEPEFTPEEIAELRRDFDEWLAKRNVSPEVLRLLRPWSEV